MKRFTLTSFLFFFIIGFELCAQEHHYYITAKPGISLEPLSVNKQRNGTLVLNLSNQNIESFFANQTVYEYKQAFPTAETPSLQRVYEVVLDKDDYLNDIQSLNEIEFAEYAGDGVFEPLYTPDDYNYPSTNTKNTALELINARRAWDITQGSSTVLVGIVDDYFETTHEDLATQILYNDDTNPTGEPHGTKVAGMVAAATDNNEGIAGIGFKTKLYTYADGVGANDVLILSQKPGVKVINISYLYSCSFISAHADIFEEIYNNGVVVVCAAGNALMGGHCGEDGHGYVYPASYEHNISVTSVGHRNPSGPYGNVEDVHAAGPLPEQTHTHNDKVDICAPGYGITTTAINNSYETEGGTSFASPMVAGVVALMFAVNPNITPAQVKTILEDTAENIYDIPANQPYIGLLGAGRVNAHAAVLQAQCLYSPIPGLDLAMYNSDEDTGAEPDNLTDVIWYSPDIWVRNQPDGRLVQEHQDLQYVNDQTPVYIYVKVINKSCETSLGTERLHLYWAKGGLLQVWPTVWTGCFSKGLLVGDDVGDQPIPVLTPGESTILEFEWQPENPDVYKNKDFDKPWMFCFLARIVAPTNDPMAFEEDYNAATNTRNNNNIAYKNTTVLNVAGNELKGTIIAGNLSGVNPLTCDFRIFTAGATDAEIWQEAEVWIELNDFLWNRWQQSGGQGNNIQIIGGGQHRILLTGNEARLNNVSFQPDEWGLITLGANFLIQEVGNQEEFSVHVEQLRSSNQESMGGFTYQITRDNTRPPFQAIATSTEQGNNINLEATQINEAATYNWYDPDGDLIYTGTSLTISPEISKKYKLEIIADSDGHKDYDEVEIELIYLKNLIPNPASTSVSIDYNLHGANSAYLTLTNSASAVSNNYILDITQSQEIIDVSAYAPGIYVISLICDGEIVATENLAVN